MNTTQSLARLGIIAVFVGAPLLFVSTLLHPSNSDPNVPLAAFAEYAASTAWVWIHLGQFAGVVGIGIFLVAFAATVEPGRPQAWTRLGVVGTAAVIAIAAALQAVDGVALKVMVDRWAAATGDARVLAFEAAFAVRQIEIGLASLLSLLTGLTAIVFGLAITQGTRYHVGLGWVGLINGVGILAAGLAQATTGFSPVAMTLSLLTSVILLSWTLAVAVVMWRTIPHVVEANPRG